MIQKYQTYLTAIKGYAENTAVAYGKDLLEFSKWAINHREGIRWSNITREDIDAYIIHQTNRGLKPATTNRQLAAISGIYNFFIREGLLKENPVKYESRRKVASTIPNTIPTEDIAMAYENAYGVAKVLLGILSTTGMRIQEVLDMKWEDIDFSSSTIRVHGKGAKERTAYSTKDALETLQICNADGENHGRIFNIEQREARHIIYEALKPYSKAVQLSPHAIRHTFATNIAKNGANVTTLAGILGHNQIATTQRYIDMTQHDYAATVRQNNFIN